MTTDFGTIHNHHERAVFEAILDQAANHPHLASNEDLLCDVACVALNRLPPRYIRHEVDFAFYLSEKERNESDMAVNESVRFAFEFVQARVAMRARA
jgi:Late competence development protein ComFB